MELVDEEVDDVDELLLDVEDVEIVVTVELVELELDVLDVDELVDDVLVELVDDDVELVDEELVLEVLLLVEEVEELEELELVELVEDDVLDVEVDVVVPPETYICTVIWSMEKLAAETPFVTWKSNKKLFVSKSLEAQVLPQVSAEPPKDDTVSVVELQL